MRQYATVLQGRGCKGLCDSDPRFCNIGYRVSYRTHNLCRTCYRWIEGKYYLWCPCCNARTRGSPTNQGKWKYREEKRY